MDKKRVLRGIKYDRYLYLMFAPVFVWYLLFCYFPMYGLIIAFQDYSFSGGFFGSPFVGLQNFYSLLSDSMFVQAISNTLTLNSLRILVGFPLPIIFALLVSEIFHKKYLTTVQTATYLPHFINWIVLAGILNSMLSIDYGVINTILQKLGFAQIDFYSDNRFFRVMLIVTEAWKETGWSAIIYLAAIAGIDPTLYEAAMVDGANRFQRIVYITIPRIMDVVVIMFILTVGNLFQMGFDQVFNLYTPAVYETADIIDTYIVRNLTSSGNLSIPAAAGMIKSTLCFILLLFANWAVRKRGAQGIY